MICRTTQSWDTGFCNSRLHVLARDLSSQLMAVADRSGNGPAVTPGPDIGLNTEVPQERLATRSVELNREGLMAVIESDLHALAEVRPVEGRT